MAERLTPFAADGGCAPGGRPFDETAERIETGGDRPFLLDDDSAWLVRAGQVDVFSTALHDGRPVGRRTHLFRVEAGAPLFALGEAQRALGGRRGLLAVGTNGTELLRVPQSTLRALAAAPEHAGAVFALIDEWVEALCAGIARDVAPKRCAEFEAGGEVRLEPAAAARPRRNVSWVRHIEGHSMLLGRQELKVNGTGYVPVSRRAWLEAREPSRLHLLATSAVADPAVLWDGLNRLHALVLRFTEMVVEQAQAAEHERLRRRQAMGQSALAAACGRLADTMHAAEKGRRPRLRLRDDAAGEESSWYAALFAACRIVGESMGVAIKPYPTPEGHPPPRDPLAAIARASRLRTRRVALRDDWWRHDNGPLLGTTEEGRRPVALVPTARGGYVLHDPLHRTETAVTADVAATLSPLAETFYRPFPDASLGIRAVVRFGLEGCRRDLRMVVAMGGATALLGLVPPMVTGRLFNSVIPGAERSQLVQLSLVLLACASAMALLQVARAAALLRVEARMSNAIQSAVWDRLLSLPVPFFRPYAAGDLAVRAMSVDAMRQLVAGTTITAVLSGVFSLVNFGLMFWYSATMAWRATLLIALAVVATAVGSYLQLTHQRGIIELQAKTSGLVLQLLTSIAKLRVAAAEAQAFSLWARRFSEQRRLQVRVRGIGAAVAAFNAAFPVLASAVLFWAAIPALDAKESAMRTGDFLAFLAAYGACQGALLGACAALLSMLNVIPLYEQAKPILATRPEVDTAKGDPGALSGDIEIQHATFRYDAEGPQVLRDVSLHVRAGEFVAFVGPSGSGKSTILRLLLGFETLESGAISYDGQEIGGLDIQAVRRQIGVVLQNGRLMSGDIFTNIIGSSPASLDDAWEAAEMAGFAADVKAMPMGMHTVISDGGGTLSGGQRQRLMIARAIVHRPRMLFFDEATSALDNRTQAIVSASLERLNATRIVVAHRLSTIVNADRIYVVERGRIVQSGNYAELMAQPGLFAELASRQIA